MQNIAIAFINHIGRTLCSLKNHPVEATISTAANYSFCREAITWAPKAFMRWQFGDILHDWKMEFRINCPLNASTYDKGCVNFIYKDTLPWAHDEDSEDVFPDAPCNMCGLEYLHL